MCACGNRILLKVNSDLHRESLIMESVGSLPVSGPFFKVINLKFPSVVNGLCK